MERTTTNGDVEVTSEDIGTRIIVQRKGSHGDVANATRKGAHLATDIAVERLVA